MSLPPPADRGGNAIIDHLQYKHQKSGFSRVFLSASAPFRPIVCMECGESVMLRLFFPKRTDLHLIFQSVNKLRHILQSVGIERTDADLHLWMHFPHCRDEVITIENQRAVSRPCSARIRSVRVSLILIHYHINRYLNFLKLLTALWLYLWLFLNIEI